jgi:mono/diheme cytochrome c family protein
LVAPTLSQLGATRSVAAVRCHAKRGGEDSRLLVRLLFWLGKDRVMTRVPRWLILLTCLGVAGLLFGCRRTTTPTSPEVSPVASAAPQPSTTGSGGVATGQQIFEKNCFRCHSPNKKGKKDLTGVGKDPKHTVDWIVEQIRDPQAHNSKMPAFGKDKLSDEDVRAVAEYVKGL